MGTRAFPYERKVETFNPCRVCTVVRYPSKVTRRLNESTYFRSLYFPHNKRIHPKKEKKNTEHLYKNSTNIQSFLNRGKQRPLTARDWFHLEVIRSRQLRSASIQIRISTRWISIRRGTLLCGNHQTSSSWKGGKGGWQIRVGEATVLRIIIN